MNHSISVGGTAGRRLGFVLLALLLLVLSDEGVRAEGFAIEDPVAGTTAKDAWKRRSHLGPKSQQCMRCHGMATLAFRDLKTGEYRNMSVKPEFFLNSIHSRVGCTDCHRPQDYDTYPHPSPWRSRSLQCTDCHEESEKIQGHRYEFEKIESEFYKSVHFKALSHQFTCFSCHDPHVFEVGRHKETTADVIEQDNGFCLRCHSNRTDFSVYSKRPFPELKRIHLWLPKADQHWRKVRCIECHTPHSDGVSHEIVGADRAERDCVVCHRRDSIMLTKLYQHRIQEGRERAGFVNSVVLTDAYVLGMTRNRFLDNVSVLLIAATLAGVGGHALGRYIGNRNRRRKPRA